MSQTDITRAAVFTAQLYHHAITSARPPSHPIFPSCRENRQTTTYRGLWAVPFRTRRSSPGEGLVTAREIDAGPREAAQPRLAVGISAAEPSPAVIRPAGRGRAAP